MITSRPPLWSAVGGVVPNPVVYTIAATSSFVEVELFNTTGKRIAQTRQRTFGGQAKVDVSSFLRSQVRSVMDYPQDGTIRRDDAATVDYYIKWRPTAESPWNSDQANVRHAVNAAADAVNGDFDAWVIRDANATTEAPTTMPMTTAPFTEAPVTEAPTTQVQPKVNVGLSIIFRNAAGNDVVPPAEEVAEFSISYMQDGLVASASFTTPTASLNVPVDFNTQVTVTALSLAGVYGFVNYVQVIGTTNTTINQRSYTFTAVEDMGISAYFKEGQGDQSV